ncbi:hypothetical protein [Actinocorallia longicatena]|uniref:Uncharacterized protein n=1 Tax=Actinocorallia longicatena TaxID=111803 RepID=A0ABP6QIK8_9ACTN
MAEREVSTGVSTLLALLEARLRAFGLAVAVGESSLIARNIRESEGATAAGRAMNPGLRQEVTCQPDAAGVPWWFWVWQGPTRDAPGELEPLCPAANLEWAAERITRVLAMPEGPP